MLVKEGDAVRIGDLLCEHRGLFGLFKTQFLAPESGIIDYFSATTGHLGIRQPSLELALSAYIPGRVIAKKDHFSVTIECECAFIQGVFGVGGVRHGTLLVLEETFEREIKADDIPLQCAGRVLVGGTRVNLSALQCASERGATGFVTGSIDDATLKGYLGYDLGIAITGDEKVAMTVIITEGFGTLPISKRAQAILIASNGGEVALDGATQVRAGAVRPEIILPMQEPQKTIVALIDNDKGLHVGKEVRVIRAPYFGKISKILELPTQPQKLSSGAIAKVAKLSIDGVTCIVPRANLEVM